MIIECSNCHARYQYDPARFEGRPSKKIRCAKCHEIFEIRNPAGGATEPAAAPAAGSPPEHDMTMSRGRKSYSGTAIDSPSLADLEAQAEAEPKPPDTLGIPPDKRFSLAITDGADSAKVFRIEKARTTIGRAADITLNDPETSREHAAIEIRGNKVVLQDLGSTNGTFLESQRISAPVELSNHQEFVVGLTTLMLIVTISE